MWSLSTGSLFGAANRGLLRLEVGAVKFSDVARFFVILAGLADIRRSRRGSTGLPSREGVGEGN
jgi:hypothetical protein